MPGKSGSTKVSASTIGCPKTACQPPDNPRRFAPRICEASWGRRLCGKISKRKLLATERSRRHCWVWVQPIDRSRGRS